MGRIKYDFNNFQVKEINDLVILFYVLKTEFKNMGWVQSVL